MSWVYWNNNLKPMGPLTVYANPNWTYANQVQPCTLNTICPRIPKRVCPNALQF